MEISMGLGLMNFGRSHMALMAARKDANEPSLPLPLHASHRRPSYNLPLSKIHHVAISNKFEIWAGARSNPKMAFENKGQQNSKARKGVEGGERPIAI